MAGLRLGEALALTWSDIDFGAEVIHVTKQMGRNGETAEPKTEQGSRDVGLDPVLARLLREHKAASPYSQQGDWVFAGLTGTPLSPRNALRRGMDYAAERAGLLGGNRPKPRIHDSRHTFASGLISDGLDADYIARQLGHRDASITFRIYAGEFDRAGKAEKAKAARAARFNGLLQAAPEEAEVVRLSA